MELNTILIVIGIVSLFILEAIFEVAILSFLGAFVRRITFNRKQKFKELHQSNTKLNIAVGIISLLLIIMIPLGTLAILNN